MHTCDDIQNNIFSRKGCTSMYFVGFFPGGGGGGGGGTPIYGLYGYVPLNRVCFLLL